MPQVRPFGCIITSALTIIAGVVLLITALISVRDTNEIHNSWTLIYSLSIFSAIIGAFSIIFALGLIYVVNRQFPALTTVFSGLLILIAVLAAACAIILISGRVNSEEKTHNITEQIFRNYSDSDQIKSSKSLLTYIQQSFQCCGVEKATDWSKKYLDGTSTPDSCCKDVVPGCGKGSLLKQDRIYLRGCAEPIYFFLRKKCSSLIATNIFVMMLALLSAILGIIYERYIRQQYQLM